MLRDAKAIERRRHPVALAVAIAAVSLLSAPLSPGTSGAASAASTPAATPSPGPAPAYRCAFNVNTDAFTGADGTASAIGWLGDHNSVITCLGGTFVIQDGPDGLFQDDGFGIYAGQRTTWTDADGYLPAQTTAFTIAGGATVSITEFADRVVLGGQPFVAVYSRVRVVEPHGPHDHGRPRRLRRSRTARQRTRRRPSPPRRRSRLRRRVRPFRQRCCVAEQRGPPGGRRIRLRTSHTCARSGTRSSPTSPRSACPMPRWSTRTRAASSPRRSHEAATTSTPVSMATRASSATTWWAF